MKKKSELIPLTNKRPEEIITGSDPVAINLLKQIYSTLKDKEHNNLDASEKNWVDGLEQAYSDKKNHEISLMDGLMQQAQDLLNSKTWGIPKEQFYSALEKIIFLKAREEVFKDFFDGVEDTISSAMQLDFSKKVPFSTIVGNEKQNVLNYAALMVNMLVEAMSNSVVSMKAVNAIVSSMPEIITIVTDKNGTIRFISDLGEKLLEIEHNALLGQSIKNVFKNFSDIDAELKKNGHVSNTRIDVIMQGQLSETISAVLTIPKLYKNWSETEEVVYTIKIQSSEQKDSVFNLMHELHDRIGPLNTIVGAVNLLGKRFIDKDSKELLDIVARCAARLKQDASDRIKEIAKPSILNSLELIDISAVLNDVIESLSLNEGFQDVTFIKQIRSLNFYSKEKLFRSILQNLISNAIKYRKTKERNIIVVVFTKPSPEEFLLEIRDSGMGMEKNVQEKIFEKGYRASTNVEGFGVGLAIVKDAVEKLKGKITVSSSPGKGSIFSVHLPKL